MKFRYVLFTGLMLTGLSLSAQKKEIKQAEDAIQTENYAQAKQLLNFSESDVSSLNDKFKARYYGAHGVATAAMSNGDFGQIEEALRSLKKAEELGNKSDADKGRHLIGNSLLEAGMKDQENQNFKGASQKFQKVYEINPTDTIFLFAAAANSLNGQDYDTAIKYYKKLRDIGFKGDDLKYTAVNKETGEEQAFDNQADRDFFVKSGDYINPSTKREERKDGEVIKNLALAYLQKGDKDKANEAIAEARRRAPNDPEMIKMEAMVYEQTGNTEKYIETLEVLIDKDPENAASYYVIIGDHMLLDKKDAKEARKYYEKATQADDTSVAAYNGIANTYLEKQEGIAKEMRNLGMTAADNKRYDELEKERNGLLASALPYLEKALKNAPDNYELMQTIYQINTQLGKKDAADKIKQQMEALGN